MISSIEAKTAHFGLAAVLVVATAGWCDTHAQTMDAAPSIVLSRPLSIRSAGLNGAGAALVGNAGAVWNNPAGIATIRNVGFEGSFRRVPTGGSIASGALAWGIRQFDLGFSFARLATGTDQVGLPMPGAPVGTDMREYAGTGSLVYRFGIIAIGGTGKYVQRTVDSNREGTLSADAGLAIAIFDIIAIGVSAQNIGGAWASDSPIELPGLTRAALMWNYVDPQETFRLLSTVEFQWPENDDFRVVFGGEGGIVAGDVGLLGRAAYVAGPPGDLLSHMTYGGSFTIAALSLDYAYQESDLNGEPSHRFGFRLTF